MLPQQDLTPDVEKPTAGMARPFEEKNISVLQKFLIISVEMFGLGMG